MRKWKRMGRAMVLCGLVLLLGAAVCMAEKIDMEDMDLRFVDASDNIGYYVDMTSLQFKGDQEVTARIEIVHADKGRFYLYRVKFDRKQMLYQILSSDVGTYGTRERIGGEGLQKKPIKYMPGSPMALIVEYIYKPQP